MRFNSMLSHHQLKYGLLIFLVFFYSVSFGKELNEDQLKIAITLNLSLMISWPKSVSFANSFNLCIYNNDLDFESKIKRINGKPLPNKKSQINVRFITEERGAESCHIIFFNKIIPDTFHLENYKKTLIISDDKNTLVKNGHILLKFKGVRNKNISMNIRRKRLERLGFKISYRILRLHSTKEVE